MDNLKTFVWRDVLWGDGPGMMVAVARNVDEARRLLRARFEARMGYVDAMAEADLQTIPEVWHVAQADFIWGSTGQGEMGTGGMEGCRARV